MRLVCVCESFFVKSYMYLRMYNDIKISKVKVSAVYEKNKLSRLSSVFI